MNYLFRTYQPLIKNVYKPASYGYKTSEDKQTSMVVNFRLKIENIFLLLVVTSSKQSSKLLSPKTALDFVCFLLSITTYVFVAQCFHAAKLTKPASIIALIKKQQLAMQKKSLSCIPELSTPSLDNDYTVVALPVVFIHFKF